MNNSINRHDYNHTETAIENYVKALQLLASFRKRNNIKKAA